MRLNFWPEVVRLLDGLVPLEQALVDLSLQKLRLKHQLLPLKIDIKFNQCDHIGQFLEFLDNFFIKIAQMFSDFWGSLENHYFLSQTG